MNTTDSQNASESRLSPTAVAALRFIDQGRARRARAVLRQQQRSRPLEQWEVYAAGLLASGCERSPVVPAEAIASHEPWALALAAHGARHAADPERALTYARESIRYEPHTAEAQWLLASCLAGAGLWDEGEEVVTRLNRDHPSHIRGWLIRIGLHTSRAQYDRALRASDTACQSTRHHALVMFARAHVLFLCRRYEQVVDVLRTLCASNETDPAASYLLGRALLLSYRDTEAAEAFIDTLQRIERAVTRPSRLVTSTAPYFMCGEDLKDCAFLGRREDHRLAVVEQLANAYFLSGDFARAQHWFERAIPLGASSGIRYRLGATLYLAGQFDDATRILRSTFESDPTDSRSAFVVSSILLERGYESQATLILRRAIDGQLSKLHVPVQPPASVHEKSTAVALLPWNTRAYLPYGLIHPLIDQYTAEPYEDFALRYASVPQSHDEAVERALLALRGFKETQSYLEETCPQISKGRIFEFLESRHFLTQATMPIEGDLLVSHTSPYNFLGRPWAVHVEHPITFLNPFFTYGRLMHTDLRQVPAFWLLKAYFEHDSCRAIFSHLPDTCDAIKSLFNSEEISRKVRYVPFGLARRSRAPIGRSSTSNDRCRVLFTSSFNQQDVSFYSRGGLYVLTSFLELADKYKNLELVIRATIPLDLPRELSTALFTHPRIVLMSRRVSENELDDLFASTDIFPLITYTIHCLSLVRAMDSGCACIVSDAPDYDGLVQDEETAIVVKGRRGIIYDRDPRTKLVRDDVPTLRAFDSSYAARVTNAFERLIADPRRRSEIGANAREYVATHHQSGTARTSFANMIRSALQQTPVPVGAATRA